VSQHRDLPIGMGPDGAIRQALALFARRSIPLSRRAALRRSRVAWPRRRAAGRPDRRRHRPARLLQRRRLQQHRSLLGLEPVNHVAARQGMGRIWSARAHLRPGRSFRIHSENTRCATAVRRRGHPHFPSAKYLVIPAVSCLCTLHRANTPDRGRAALRRLASFL
jgi:hypothetical protein